MPEGIFLPKKVYGFYWFAAGVGTDIEYDFKNAGWKEKDF
jgi:hypothetical protein